MALSSKVVDGATFTVAAAGTSVEVAPALGEACHTVVVKNLHATAELYLDQGAAGGPIAPAAAGYRIAGGESVTIPIGTANNRGGDSLNTVGSRFIVDSDTAGATCHVTCVNGSTGAE